MKRKFYKTPNELQMTRVGENVKTRKFLDVSRCSHAKQRQGNVQKSVLQFIGVREILCQGVGGWGGGGGRKPFAPKNSRKLANFLRNVQSKRNEGHTMQQHRPYWHMKVARYCNSFSGSIAPNSEHNYVAIDKHLEKLPPHFY